MGGQAITTNFRSEVRDSRSLDFWGGVALMGTFGKSRISDMRGGIREEWGG